MEEDPFDFITQQAIIPPFQPQPTTLAFQDLFPNDHSSFPPEKEEEEVEQYYTPEEQLPTLSEEVRRIEHPPRNDEEVQSILTPPVVLPRKNQIFKGNSTTCVEKLAQPIVDHSEGVSKNQIFKGRSTSFGLPDCVVLDGGEDDCVDIPRDTQHKGKEIEVGLVRCSNASSNAAGASTQVRKLPNWRDEFAPRNGLRGSRGGGRRHLHCGGEGTGRSARRGGRNGSPMLGGGGGVENSAQGERQGRKAAAAAAAAEVEKVPSAENVDKIFVTLSDLVNDDDDDDILVVAIKAGMKFPRPRHWGNRNATKASN